MHLSLHYIPGVSRVSTILMNLQVISKEQYINRCVYLSGSRKYRYPPQKMAIANFKGEGARKNNQWKCDC